MKLKQVMLAMGLFGAAVGVAQAAPLPADTISKKITLTANINDALFVSKPDGSTWYGTEELAADDYTQKRFTATLPIRVWSKNSEFNVSLAQPLKMSNGMAQMQNALVKFSQSSGQNEVKFGSPLKVTQVQDGVGGKDEIHNLDISVEAPEGDNTNGSYSGDLVMLFEPVVAPSN
ncbi:fimbrial protein [Pseudomonas sp. MCal1]|uniref:CS1 type fimbrial major subunit n=1 Tax=Pseudomonas sp. MCal1 TaxID=2919887 RepID=UPI002257AD75|nr:CS1 type fimbrial major subunit [Pseudomonas sp. MCal1]MCX4220256.1 fimbrial protein [Pseudomonas sp. MCal1]